MSLERWPDALEQLRLTGPYATSFPWDRDADDPLGRFLEVRQGVRAAMAFGSPGGGNRFLRHGLRPSEE
ncbi:predicted protein [Streptomyces viridosporus ATCC 14672]|uniref:Predicted protein n=1 Tax=Streptomyces viridosporus (strain ATCC 14672 / DSM 40746 / JCM 4963 / KCTC 9882 / NRRL B-12104 / FH 1290) TaxID=566461 RepID=D6A9M5_STRV1|nr:predicted protein [Streptomyces viridosporus ATCC 14672]